jgi:hypothetical protein
MSVETRSWQELCEAITKETDSGQLMWLTAQLLRALDERKGSVAHTKPEESPSFFEHPQLPAIGASMSADEGLAPLQ